MGHGGAANVPARRRLGIFGGSFDPPHRGHLAVAQAAAEAFSLDEILVSPTGLQPLKSAGAAAPFLDRLKMVEILCEAEAGRLRASGFDAPRDDGMPNYTAELLERLRSDEPNAAVFVVIGEDSLMELPRWRNAERLRALAEWIVVSRPGFPANSVGSDELEGFAIHRLGTLSIPLASRALRERLRSGDDCADAIPSKVLAYILEHGLYGTGKTLFARG